jgi:hypothetical protein
MAPAFIVFPIWWLFIFGNCKNNLIKAEFGKD